MYFFLLIFRSPRGSKTMTVPPPIDHSPLWTTLTNANSVTNINDDDDDDDT